MGAIGSAAPWFLTGWTKDMEVEFMIDTGCQVMILAMSVFERMCAAEPQVRSRLRIWPYIIMIAYTSPVCHSCYLLLYLTILCNMPLASCALMITFCQIYLGLQYKQQTTAQLLLAKLGGGVYTPHDSPITKIKFVNSPITKNSEPFHQSPKIITDHQSPRISISVVLI